MREPVLADTVQVALVARDLQASMKTYGGRHRGVDFAYLPDGRYPLELESK